MSAKKQDGRNRQRPKKGENKRKHEEMKWAL